MSKLRQFSQALYDFHTKKVGEKEGYYHSIETLCSVAKDHFVTELENVDESEFAATHLPGRSPSEKKNKLLTWIKCKIDKINDIVKRESENNMLAAIDLYEILFDKKTVMPKYKYMTCSVAAHTDFYRIRSAEKYDLYDKTGMFVLSDELEHLAGANRFNQSGFACLYLASNLYLAWEETRRPDFDKLNFSRFQNTRNIEVLDLTINKECKFQGHFLMAYLSLLCGAKTTDKDNHNYQYVVPQMIMKVLCHRINEYEKRSPKKGSPIDGIKYMSSRRFDQKDLLFNDWRLTISYVFPQRPHAKENVCPHLVKLFKLTEPRTYFFFKIHRYDFHSRKARVSDYEDSLFYQLEEEMKKCELKRYDK